MENIFKNSFQKYFIKSIGVIKAINLIGNFLYFS